MAIDGSFGDSDFGDVNMGDGDLGDADYGDADSSDADSSDASPPPSDGGAKALCTTTGGTVSTSLCCASTGDFPDTCGVGACGCAPSSSHTVAVCDCPGSKCFDTTKGCTTALPP